MLQLPHSDVTTLMADDTACHMMVYATAAILMAEDTTCHMVVYAAAATLMADDTAYCMMLYATAATSASASICVIQASASALQHSCNCI